MAEEETVYAYTGMAKVVANIYAKGHCFDDLLQVCLLSIVECHRKREKVIDGNFTKYVTYWMNVDCIEYISADHVIAIPRNQYKGKPIRVGPIDFDDDENAPTIPGDNSLEFKEILSLSCTDWIERDLVKRIMNGDTIREIANYYKRSDWWVNNKLEPVFTRFKALW